ncbi:tetratricopeptide repeat protein [Patescibacteria group bacterium]|nr:tetratricopeptide repeat protein [Patescibacteria group bacterium]MCL5010026.1 tetratricopeptide repeat protein [Patescibacteria group bacterium]
MMLARRILNRLEKTNLLYLFTVIFIFAFIVYGLSLFNGFVWDDEEQVTANSIIQHLSNIPYLFATSTFNNGGASGLSGLYYKPLMPVSFALNYAIWQGHPFGFHLFSLALHILNTFLVFILFKKLFSWKGFNYANSISFLLALLFLVHPANVESVSYIASTQELLYTFFTLICVIVSLTYFLDNKTSFKILLFINAAILLSLLSKESGIISIPLVIMLSFLFKKKKLYVIASSAVTFLIYLTLRFAVAKTPIFNSKSIVPIAQADFPTRLKTVPYELFSYIRLLFFPKDLFVAQYNVIKSISDPRFYLCLAACLIFFSILIIFYRRIKSRLYLFFLFWFIFAIGIVLNIYPLDMTIAERWLYGPMIALLGMIGTVILFCAKKDNRIIVWFSILCLFVIPLFAARSLIRSIDWKSDFSLFSHDIKYSGNSFEAQNNLGVALFRKGKFKDAKIHFEKSIALSPKWWTSYNNLGVVYEREDNLPKALSLYKKSIVNGNYYLGYENFAKILFREKKWSQLIRFTKNALVKLPLNETLNKLAAVSYYRTNKMAKARLYAKQAFLIDPSSGNYAFLQFLENR